MQSHLYTTYSVSMKRVKLKSEPNFEGELELEHDIDWLVETKLGN